MATLTVATPGYTVTAVGAGQACNSGGDVFPNNGKTMIRFKNTNGTARNVTIAPVNTGVAPWVTSNKTIAINVPLTTGDVIVGPFEKSIYDNSSGQVAMTYDAVTDLTFYAWSI